MSASTSSIPEFTDAELYRYAEDRSTEIMHAIQKAGDDALTGIITPEQSDIDIGRLLNVLKAVQGNVETEQARRKKKKQILHRTMLMAISVLAAGFFYFVFFN